MLANCFGMCNHHPISSRNPVTLNLPDFWSSSTGCDQNPLIKMGSPSPWIPPNPPFWKGGFGGDPPVQLPREDKIALLMQLLLTTPSSTLMASKFSYSLHIFIAAPRTINDNAGTASQLLAESRQIGDRVSGFQSWDNAL